MRSANKIEISLGAGVVVLCLLIGGILMALCWHNLHATQFQQFLWRDRVERASVFALYAERY